MRSPIHVLRQGALNQRQSTVGVMTKNTDLQLWCMYLSGSAYLLMRTESDYCTLWSLAEAVCLPARVPAKN